ncbi:Na+/galactose cotransporter, partial [Mycobacteroides abscessus subsp. abscessus]|nr:Na+/galactose cotransporter [Mycobacteroides abscessus subsp. abscessus]
WSLFETGVCTLSGQGSNFIEAGVAFTVDIVVSVAVSWTTEPKPAAELAGLVYSETPHAFSNDEPASGWFRQPVKLAMTAL